MNIVFRTSRYLYDVFSSYDPKCLFSFDTFECIHLLMAILHRFLYSELQGSFASLTGSYPACENEQALALRAGDTF